MYIMLNSISDRLRKACRHYLYANGVVSDQHPIVHVCNHLITLPIFKEHALAFGIWVYSFQLRTTGYFFSE